MTVNAKKIAGRRKLHFESLDEMLADVEILASSDVQMLGNWSLPQILDHLSRAMEVSIDGVKNKLPLWMRILTRPMRKWIVSRPMPSGFKMPGAIRPDFAPSDDVPLDQAVERFRAAVERLKTTPERAPHVMLGRLTREDFDRLHLRHAEMHLGFAVPH